MQSDAAEEFDELLLKARAPMAAIAQAVTGRVGPDAVTVGSSPPGWRRWRGGPAPEPSAVGAGADLRDRAVGGDGCGEASVPDRRGCA